MSIIEAIVLGLLQGLSEFIPISSTGHLTVAGKLMNLISAEHPEYWTAFIAVIQLGTLLAVLLYFRKDIVSITADFLKDNLKERKSFKSQSLNSRLGWLILAGSVPIVIIGLLFKQEIEGTFTKDLTVIAISLIALALILAIAEKVARHRRKIDQMNFLDAILIGIAQAVALIPGSSRSGTTITGGLFMGFERETAARFSFLLSIPAVLASGLLQLYEALKFIDQSMALNLIISTVVSGISGYAAIDFLLKFLRRHTTFLFIYYRIALGILIFILLSLNVIQS
ncbi:MAG: undecaprenyl-diphosphate phosphatase [Ignavibacteriaceae bacterium]